MRICLQCGAENTDGGGDACTSCGGPVAGVADGRDPLEGRLLSDRYILGKRLGQGGFGSVYTARHSKLDQEVAIKVLKSDLAAHPEMLERFYREARNTSKLRHPHNVRVFDFGHTADGLVFIVMELIDGVALDSLERPMSPVRAISLLDQACAALAEAHELGLVHRDLKPENLMISLVDGEDYVRVLDYGIAKIENSATGFTKGGFIGTPRYSAPEQAMGVPLDRRSDIYALGLIAYELLTGQPPFPQTDPIALLVAHRDQIPSPPSELAAISPELDQLVVDCLRKAPGDRPATMHAMRERLWALPEWLATGSGSKSGIRLARGGETSPSPAGSAPTVQSPGSSGLLRVGTRPEPPSRAMPGRSGVSTDRPPPSLPTASPEATAETIQTPSKVSANVGPPAVEPESTAAVEAPAPVERYDDRGRRSVAPLVLFGLAVVAMSAVVAVLAVRLSAPPSTAQTGAAVASSAEARSERAVPVTPGADEGDGSAVAAIEPPPADPEALAADRTVTALVGSLGTAAARSVATLAGSVAVSMSGRPAPARPPSSGRTRATAGGTHGVVARPSAASDRDPDANETATASPPSTDESTRGDRSGEPSMDEPSTEPAEAERTAQARTAADELQRMIDARVGEDEAEEPSAASELEDLLRNR